jgi:NTP pyrophosphatase (non-canonical NTP hydrolase)
MKLVIPDLGLDAYQEAASTTAIYREALETQTERTNYCLLGLGGEVGELLNKWKKFHRDGLEFEAVRSTLLEELGDVLWYAALLAVELDMPLSLIASGNLAKLRDRQERGVLGGSGDER